MSAPSRREIDEQIEQRLAMFHAAMQSADREERKEALKQAFKELMHEQLARLGAWTLAGIGTLVVGTVMTMVLWFLAVKAGWTPPR